MAYDRACAVASLCAGEGAAGLLLDFAQAFPSLVHDWLFRVLDNLRLPAQLVALICAMYRCNPIVFEVSGSPVVEIVVESGIGQGCPLSGSLSASVLDPRLRRLMAHRMLASARLFAYSDYVAVLRRLRTELPQLLQTLQWRAAVSGLALKPSKCVVLPEGGMENLHDFLDCDAGLPGARVAQAARFVGATVGTYVRGAQWGEVAVELEARSRDIAAFGAASQTRLRLFARHCRSIVPPGRRLGQGAQSSCPEGYVGPMDGDAASFRAQH